MKTFSAQNLYAVQVSRPQHKSHKRILCKFDVPLEHFSVETQGPLSSLSGSLIEWPLSALDSWPEITTTAANNEQNSESCQALKYATIFTLRTGAITQLQSE